MIVLRKQAETNSDITLEWDAVQGAVGYRFQSATSAPKWSHTFDPTRTSIKFSKGSAWYKVEALGVEDAGEYPQVAPPPPPPPPPTGVGFSFPASGHVFGGNSAQAMATHDFVIAAAPADGNPKQARAAGNPQLKAVFQIAFNPWTSDWRTRRSSALTYGAGFRGAANGIEGGPSFGPWPGVNDTLQPNPQGQIKGFNAGTDDSCVAQGQMHFDLSNPATAEMIRKGAYYAWKLGKGAENGWDGIWSDNLFPGRLLLSGNCFGSTPCGQALSKSAWDAGLTGIANYLRSNGVPMVGGNTLYRTDSDAVRVANNLAMNEVLEQQIAGGATAFATSLSETQAWLKAAPGPRYLVTMHIVPQSNAAMMKFGLALACIQGSVYLPYSNGHHDLYLPAEMKKNGQRNYLGKPTADPVRSGNTWTRQFEHGKVTASFDSKTATFS